MTVPLSRVQLINSLDPQGKEAMRDLLWIAGPRQVKNETTQKTEKSIVALARDELGWVQIQIVSDDDNPGKLWLVPPSYVRWVEQAPKQENVLAPSALHQNGGPFDATATDQLSTNIPPVSSHGRDRGKHGGRR